MPLNRPRIDENAQLAIGSANFDPKTVYALLGMRACMHYYHNPLWTELWHLLRTERSRFEAAQRKNGAIGEKWQD